MKTKNKLPTPLGNRILVSRVDFDELDSGIIIPDSAKRKSNRANVLAVGEGEKDKPMRLKKGDVVLISAYAGTPICDDDNAEIIVNQDDVLAIFQ